MGSLIFDNRDASGLYYRRERYYDSDKGRFTQEDPIGLAGGVNVYGYGGGDPLSYSDPYGLCCAPGSPTPRTRPTSAVAHTRRIGLFGSLLDPLGAWVDRNRPLLTMIALDIANRGMAGVQMSPEGTRYMGPGEAGVVERTNEIPNTTAQGRPKIIHYTTDEPVTSASEAQRRYKLPEAPTHMCRFPLCNVTNDVPPEGPVAPGATQRATSDPIRGVSKPVPLDP
jgi:RHS repeat-associated protein